MRVKVRVALLAFLSFGFRSKQRRKRQHDAYETKRNGDGARGTIGQKQNGGDSRGNGGDQNGDAETFF